MIDLLILNGTIIDGTGNPGYRGSVGIKAEKIVLSQVGSVSSEHVIDAHGLMVAPGFIDAHAHSDFVFFRDPRPDMKIRQGVTSEIVGSCGSSAAPLTDKSINLVEPYVTETIKTIGHYQSFGEYLLKVQDYGIINNQAIFVGHRAIRTAIMGMEARPASKGELADMKNLLAETLGQGAFGLSSGLLYPPMCFAETEELVELCRVVASQGKVFSCHMRNYSSDLGASIREIIKIAEMSGVAVHISHFMLAGKLNWGKANDMLELIDTARQRGLDLTIDQYPYRAANPGLRALLPPWMHSGGLEKTVERLQNENERRKAKKDIENGIPGWENIAVEAGWENLVVMSKNLPELSGKTLAEIANSRKQAPVLSVFELLLQDINCHVIAHWVNEADVRTIMRYSNQMVSSDSSEPGPVCHPRTYGTFPRVLGKYTRKEGVLQWEDAVRKMSSFPARRFGLHNRGLILGGLQADLVIFDPQTVAATSTFEYPDQYPTGIKHVIVNGKLVIENGEYKGAIYGQTLNAAQVTP